MRRKFCVFGFVFVALALSGLANAQFGGLLGGGKDSGSASPEVIVKGYVEGAKLVLKAQERLLLAVGRKQEAAAAALQADNLTEGATKQNLEDAAKTQTQNSKILEESFRGKEAQLDAQSKVTYAQGLGSLGQGIGKYVNLVPKLKGFKPGANMLGSAAQGASYIVSTLPDNASALQVTLGAAIKFGESQGVPIPQDATAALK